MPTPKFNDYAEGEGGHWSTKDITVAALVASFGFKWRGKAPIMHIIHANRLISVIDKSTGRIEDTQTIGYFFDYQTSSDVHGLISCPAISVSYEKRRIDNQLESGEYVPSSKIEQINKLLKNHNVSDRLCREVCLMADAIENIMVISAGVEELACDPLIQIAKALRKGRLDILRPMETEPVAQRFLENIAKNA